MGPPPISADENKSTQKGPPTQAWGSQGRFREGVIEIRSLEEREEGRGFCTEEGRLKPMVAFDMQSTALESEKH